jgi:hypothetical protein
MLVRACTKSATHVPTHNDLPTRMQAASLYRSAAIQGLADAQNRLGMCYDSGVGVAKDESEAVKWFKLAANQNLPAGQYNLGDCYKRGYVVQSITCAHYRPRQPPLPTYTCITTNIAAAACSNTCSDCFAYDLSNNLSHNVAINFINTTTNIVTNYVCKAKSVLLSRACTCTRVYLACIHSTGPCSSLKLVLYSCLSCLHTLHRSMFLSQACTCTHVYLACIHSTGPCSSLKLVHVLMSTTLPANTPQDWCREERRRGVAALSACGRAG